MKSKKAILFYSFSVIVMIGAFSPYFALCKDRLEPKVEENSGFYYDSEREKYFSNERSKFSIRPTKSGDHIEQIAVSIDGAEFVPYKGIFAFQSEGIHQIRFRAADPVLNWSPIQTYRVYVDKTPPKSQVVWQGPTYSNGKDVYVNPNTRLSLLSQDGLSGVRQVTMIQDKVSKPFPGQMLFNKEGPYTIQFSAVDNVGNVEPPYSTSFVVDARAPESRAQIRGTSFENSKGMFVSSGSRIELTANDALSGVHKIEYQINDGPTTIYSNSIVITENRTKIKYRSVDNVGNEESWKTIAVLQDTKPPRVTVQKVGNSVAIGGKVYSKLGFKLSAKVSDDESGVKEILVARNDKGFIATKDTEFSFDAKGESQFTLKAVDNIENFEESNPYTISIDNDPPTSSYKSAHPLVLRNGVYLSSVPNRIEFQAVDGGVGVEQIEISYDGKRFESLNSPIEVSEWKSPRQTIHYRAIDRLGNTEAIKKLDILVSTMGPEMDLFVEPENLPNVPLSNILKGKRKGEGSNRAPASVQVEDSESEDDSEEKDSR